MIREQRQITYGAPDLEFGGATFVPVCEKCGRYVKADKEIAFDWQGQPKSPNASCTRCGPTAMLWQGYY